DVLRRLMAARELRLGAAVDAVDLETGEGNRPLPVGDVHEPEERRRAGLERGHVLVGHQQDFSAANRDRHPQRRGGRGRERPTPATAPGRGSCAGTASRLASMIPLTARTLWEWVFGGTSTADNWRGVAGSLTSTSVVPCGAFMWAMNATRPSTTTWPPPGQSK